MKRSALLLPVFLLAGLPQDEAAPDFTLPDYHGKPHALSALKGRKAVVLVFTGIECPRGVAAEPRLSEMAQKYAEQGVAFLAINSNRNESPEAVIDHLKKSQFLIPMLRDDKGSVSNLYRVEIQPTAFVLDGELRVRYRGMIDNHKIEELVRKHYLRDALEAVLAGRPVEVKETEPEGCTVRKREPATGAAEVTYAKDVAPILNKHCVSCHRPGQVGPFSLETYEQASAWSREVMTYTKRRAMPPWKPVTNPDFYWNERRMTDAEIATLRKWHEAGTPLGDPKDLPPPPKVDPGWMLGTPDHVVKAEGGWIVGPKGRDEYRCYAIRNPFDEDKWVTGVEYRPGNLRAVHHIIGYLDAGGQSAKKDAADPQPGYKSNGSGPGILPSGSLAGWAPGNMPRLLPEGTARLLKKGEWIVLETHYHRTGRPETDEGAQVGLYFAKKPVQKQLHVHMIANPFFRIPPGAERHKVVATYTVPKDVRALDVMPHMHLIGREMTVTATFPDGKAMDLVAIKDWDFNWQETYQFRDLLPLPRGTKIRVEAFYDNSEKNPNNPSFPPRAVGWGEQTTDEMCIAFIHFTNDSEDLTRPNEEGKK
jgi:peroxiredoxin